MREEGNGDMPGHMIGSGLLGKAAGVLVTGWVGAAAYDGSKRAARRVSGRELAVSTATLALKSLRRIETRAESARLATADVVAEARERIGEQAPPPTTTAADGHKH